MYRHYLLGRRFIVRTDHHSLIWMLNFKSPQDQLARWLEELSQYNMEIQHRPGRKHVNVDALSRLPHTYGAADTAMAVHLRDLPCGGCQKCTKAHEFWNTFTETVDDVAPLARPGTLIYSQEESLGAVGPDGSQTALYQCYPEGSVGATGTGQDSRAALDYVMGEFLHLAGALEEPGLDLDSDIHVTQGGPFRTQARLFLHPSVAMVVRALDGPDDGSLSFLGLSPEEMRESQQRDLDLSLFRQWLAADTEPDEGDLFLASPALKYLWLNRALFTMDEDQVLWKLTGEEESEDRL
jgi:hypothetical protein